MTDAGYWIFAMACITLFFTFLTIRRLSDNQRLSIALYICFGIFFFTLSGIRQHAAVAITTLSWPLMIERRFIRFFVITLIASMFHTTALIMLPVYFLCNIKLNSRLLLIIGIIAVPLSFVADPLIGRLAALIPDYEVYSSSQYASIINPLSILRIIYPFTLLLGILNVYGKVTSDRRSLVFTNLAIYYVFLILFFPGIPLVTRIGYYFQLSLIIFIPLMCAGMKRAGSVLFVYYTILYGICMTTVTILLRPYVNILPFELDFRLAGWPLLIMLFCVIAISSAFAHLMTSGYKIRPPKLS